MDANRTLSLVERLRDWQGEGRPAMIVRVAATQGSVPRDDDAAMAVTADSAVGTIGGGQLEWLAIGQAREMLAGTRPIAAAEIALGPEIGQCCGGRVRLTYRLADEAALAELERAAKAQEQENGDVLIFGAGHTGRALGIAMAPLPVRLTIVDERPETLGGLPEAVATKATALPEAVVDSARSGSAFVAMTHLHSLDFQIMAAALKRGDAAYCGMIGSKTKRAVFASWLADEGHGRQLAEKLTCPIGGAAVRDKRPQVIAAMTAAEILAALYGRSSSQGSG